MEHPHDLLDFEERCFNATGNPLHAWAAYSLARVAGATVPDWVLRYLDVAARGIMATASEAAREDGGSDPGPRIAKALRMQGKHLTGYHRDANVIALNIIARIDSGENQDAAVYAVAKAFDVSYSTADRALRAYKDQLSGAAILNP